MDVSSPILDCLKVPGHPDDVRLDRQSEGFVCNQTGETYPDINGIPSLGVSTSGDTTGITDRIKSFYEENPFPSYEGLEEFGELVSKGNSNLFSRNLLDAIGYNKKILEVGCGTGQLSHYLQLNNNHVLGVDLSLSSLSLAIQHKIRNELPRVNFVQMNVFDLAIKDRSFDVVISHGVLHHTMDARSAFGHIVQKLKPGGIVMVGLYNSVARIPTYLRSKVIGVLGPKLDFVVRNRIHDARKADIWIKDQYYNPHETWHSIGEVLGWFKENGIEYLNCSPAILGTQGETNTNLFASSEPGNAYQRGITQLGWLSTIAREGALFDVIGRRK